MFNKYAYSCKPALRRFLAAAVTLSAAALCLAFAAQNAGAAATLNVSMDSTKAGGPTSLTLNTALSGLWNAKKQYGAQIHLPSTFRITDYTAYGDTDERCPGSSFSTYSSGLVPGAMAFDNGSCPEAAKIGTATLGSASGSIYWVNTTPIPQMGVYFDSGVSTPYGRRMNVTYDGPAPTIMITGLPNTSTNGLTLDFDNPARPNDLPTKVWGFVDGGDGECVPSSTITGNVWTWPYWGTTATSTSFPSKTVNITGCGIGFSVQTDNDQAGEETALTLSTPLTGTGNDVKQYGARIELPPSLRIQFPAYGTPAQQCSPAAFSSIETGYTPSAQEFDATGCPPEAMIGTATLGAASGEIYWVGTSPLPSMGVYFGAGVAEPYGRRLSHSYNDSAPILTIHGLPNDSTSGLTLDFNNPNRPTLSGKVWAFSPPSDPGCETSQASATVYTYPANGTATTTTNPLLAWVNVNGCS